MADSNRNTASDDRPDCDGARLSRNASGNVKGSRPETSAKAIVGNELPFKSSVTASMIRSPPYEL